MNANSARRKEFATSMANMVSLPRISTLALLLALASPASALAGELTPEQMNWYRTQMGVGGQVGTPPPVSSSIGDALVEWRRLSGPGVPSFERLSYFLVQNPDWPGADKMRVQAEQAIALNSFDPDRVVGYFYRLPPRTAGGHLRHALALQAKGQQAEARDALRKAWTTGSLDEAEEAAANQMFPGVLTPADHDARMDRLLWSGATRAAARQLPLVSPDKRAAFAARLAMRTGAADAGAQAAAVEAAQPDILRRDAGYLTDKATWLRRANRMGEARMILAAPRALAAPPTDAEEWLETLLTNARGAASDQDHVTAWRIASQIDDAVAPDVVVREASMGVRDDYTSLAWLGGQTALNKLGRPADAVGLFKRYGDGARSAQTRTKGYYWAGRAAQAAGDNAAAQRFYEDAAQHYDQFYGQLALERLGRGHPRPAASASLPVTADERARFEDDRLVRAARALGEIGAWRDQSLFLRAITQRARTPADHALAGALAGQIGRPDLGVMIGRSAQANGIDSVAVSGFPMTRIPEGHSGNWTFIHAITRQESQFDKAAVSHAGARGLMQLMPGTAREVSARVGMVYDVNALTSDTGYNMLLGSTYFQQMLSYFGGSYPLAIAAYNAGPGNVNKWLRANGDPRNGGIAMVDWIEAIPIFETRNYVQRVLENAVVYDTLRPGDRVLPQNLLSFYLGKRDPG